VILNLLAEGVGQPNETTHRHTHCQVLALNIAGADVLLFGITYADDLRTTLADRRTVALVVFRRIAQVRHKLRNQQLKQSSSSTPQSS